MSFIYYALYYEILLDIMGTSVEKGVNIQI